MENTQKIFDVLETIKREILKHEIAEQLFDDGKIKWEEYREITPYVSIQDIVKQRIFSLMEEAEISRDDMEEEFSYVYGDNED